MNRRLWCILCSFFLAYNLKVLFEDYSSVNYKVDEEGELHDEATNIAACTHPNWIVDNNRDNRDKHGDPIQLEPKMVTARRFLETSIEMIESSLDARNLFQVNQSYIFRGFVCFLLNQTSYENDSAVKNFLRLYHVQLFVYSPGKKPFFYEYAYNNYHNNDSLRIGMQKVYGRSYLASTNCRAQRDQLLASKFHCLQRCVFNLSVDLHLPDSSQMFSLSVLINETYDPSRNAAYHVEAKRNFSTRGHTETINNHSAERESDSRTFRKCIERCPRSDCFQETYNVITVADEKMKINIEKFVYRAYYSTGHFWLQLFGLLTLFTGTSVIDILLFLMNLAARKLKKSHQAYFARFLPEIKLSLVIFGLIFILVQSILMIIDYRFEKSYPNRTIIWDFSSKPFSVTICLPIETLIDKDTNIKKGRNSQILANFSFEQLEEMTGKFEKRVEIKLLHGNRMKNLNWTMAEKVLFKNSSFNQMNCLSRCFRIEPNFEELKYRKMLAFHYLIVRFRTQFREVFLTEKRQSFSSGLVDFKGGFFVRKTTEASLPDSRKANCKEGKMNESSKRQKIDRCINQRFLKEHSALPMNSVVDKDDFGDEIGGYRFSEANTSSIEQACTKINEAQKLCEETRFEESIKKMNSYDDASIRLNLKYENSISKEIDQSSIKVVLQILNLESIFFKNNVASCLVLFVAVLRRTFKLSWSGGKLDRFLAPSICLLGFLIHNVFVFKGIIDEKLDQNGYFNLMHEFSLPNTAFCFNLNNLTLDENHAITGNYLNGLTKELHLGKALEKLMYFNRTHDKVFRPTGDLTSYSDSELSISPFYLLDAFYCLEFRLNVRFDEEDFYILMNKFIFQISFKHSFANLTKKAFLFYRWPGQKEVSDLLDFEVGTTEAGKDPIYEIVLELVEVEKNDEFENLKDPRRLFGKSATDDVNKYLCEMQSKFEALQNLTTTEILLEAAHFDKAIDNALFEQFFFQVKNVTDHRSPNSLNSKLNFFNFYTKRIDLEGFSYFQFAILPISKRVEIRNNENFAKLIQDVLNTLSLWFNVCAADLVAYINLASSVLLRIYILFVKAQNRLDYLREI